MRYPSCSTTTESEEKGSRFLALLLPIQSPGDVKIAAQSERRKHPRANHVVYAWRTCCESTGKVEEGFSDDGEPAGTAGMPALRVLQHGELVNACILIVRYFGGTKLGTGGLQRAYSGATSATIQTAEDVFREWVISEELKISGQFQTESAVRRIMSDIDIQSAEVLYNQDGYTMTLRVTRIQKQQLILTLPFGCQLTD